MYVACNITSKLVIISKMWIIIILSEVLPLLDEKQEWILSIANLERRW